MKFEQENDEKMKYFFKLIKTYTRLHNNIKQITTKINNISITCYPSTLL